MTTEFMHVTHFVSNAGIQAAYHDLDQHGETRPPFVLVHGFTGSKLDFADQLDWFTDLARVIAYDQRGHGESSNHGPYEERRFVADLISLVDRLELPSIDLLGHSFGGMIAMRAALDHPDRIRSLILMDTSAGPLQMFPEGVRQRLNALVADQGCEAMLEAMRSSEPTAPAKLGIDFLGESEHWRRIEAKLRQMDSDAFRDIGEYFGKRENLLGRLEQLTCPVTIIVGAEDQGFLAPSRAMAAAIPNSTLEVIPEAGHSPQYENPTRWRDAVRSHLERAPLH